MVEAPRIEETEEEIVKRRELDVRLAEAEMDEVVGLDKAPSRFTLPPTPTGAPRYKLRRIESMMAAFQYRRSEVRRIESMLAAFQYRRSEVRRTESMLAAFKHRRSRVVTASEP